MNNYFATAAIIINLNSQQCKGGPLQSLPVNLLVGSYKLEKFANFMQIETIKNFLSRIYGLKKW